MTAPAQQPEYKTTDEDFDFIWKNINSPLVVRDRINVIKSHPHTPAPERTAMGEINYCEYLRLKCTGNHDCCPKATYRCITEELCMHLPDTRTRPHPPAPDTCIWSEDEDGIWNTECGNKFELISGEAPWRQGIKFCPYCGKSLRQQAGDPK